MQTRTHEQDTTATAPEADETESASAPEGAPNAEGAADGTAISDEDGIEIDGQRFSSEAEALAFAKAQLDEKKTKLAVAEAYQAGLLEQRGGTQAPQQQAPPQEDEEPDWETKFYANPRQAMKEFEERAIAKANAKIQANLTAKDEDRRVWNKFSDAHPDLADFRADVEAIANSPEHSERVRALAQTRGEDAAMEYVAQKTRAKFQAYIQASKQKTVLPRGNSAGPTPTGGAKKVTPAPQNAKPLSMQEQLRQLKSKSHKT